MDRVYNIEKSRKRKRTGSEVDDVIPQKRGRPKKQLNLETRYPKIKPSKDSSDDRQKEQAILKELDKEKPRKDLILQLMKGTFYTRRQFILNNTESVISKLTKYPALKMPNVVCVTLNAYISS